jgi:hypothetical protein
MAIRCPWKGESVEGMAKPTGTRPSASAVGQTRNNAHPSHAQTSKSSTARTLRMRRSEGEISEPKRTLTAKTAVSRPMAPADRP